MNGGNLRPLGVGEMLDAGIKIYRARWRPLITVVLAATIPIFLLQGLVQLSVGSPDALTKTDPKTNLITVDTKGLGIYFGAAAVLLVLSFIASAVATAGAFRIVAGSYLGDEPTWKESLRFAWRHVGSLLWILLLVLLASILGLVACGVGLVWVRVVFAFAVPVLLVEDARGAAALRRSRALVNGRFWPVLGVLLLASLLALVGQAIVTTPALILTVTQAGSVASLIASFIANVAGTAFVTPFLAAVTMVVYFDLRVRSEGFDLLLLSQRVGVTPPPEGFPAQPGANPWASPSGYAPPTHYPDPQYPQYPQYPPSSPPPPPPPLPPARNESSAPWDRPPPADPTS